MLLADLPGTPDKSTLDTQVEDELPQVEDSSSPPTHPAPTPDHTAPSALLPVTALQLLPLLLSTQEKGNHPFFYGQQLFDISTSTLKPQLLTSKEQHLLELTNNQVNCTISHVIMLLFIVLYTHTGLVSSLCIHAEALEVR